ncbi:MAG TPA: rRNA maturation RNase YbeY [Elusimicrobiota bacterium]|nr:rRNA maturation RNase YbeY [Elusimicrobiota bacterium]
MNVLFFGAAKTPAARALPKMKKAVLAALGPLRRRRGELCVIFVDDRAMRRLNKQFLAHDYATDVISFRHEADGLPRSADTPFGDVYVATGVAKRQALEQGHDATTELLTLAVHGALHLAGYDDKKAADKKRMFKRQDALVRAHST